MGGFWCLLFIIHSYSCNRLFYQIVLNVRKPIYTKLTWKSLSGKNLRIKAEMLSYFGKTVDHLS